MSDEVVLVIAALVSLVLVIALFKLLGSAIKALLIALVAGGLLYMLLPKLEAQEGAIGDAARKARQVSDDLGASVQGLREQASEATRVVSEGLDQMHEAAEAVEAVGDKAKQVRHREETLKGELVD